MILPGVDLARPLSLWLLALVPALAVLALVAWRARGRALALFGGRSARLVSRRPLIGVLKIALVLVAIAASIGALAGPRVGVTERQVAQQGADFVIALDVSQSMAAQDVRPNRLHAARDAIESLARDLQGSRVALVLFAGDAIARYPVTSDPAAITLALENSGGGFKPSAGSSLRAGIDAALAAFPASSGKRHRSVLVLSDGADGDTALPDIAAIRERGVRFFAIGVGTPSGAQVPTYDTQGRLTGVIRATDGTPVVSRLDERGLRAIAEQGGGAYWQFTGGDAPLRALIGELRTLDVSDVSDENVPADRFQWLVALALGALILDLLLGERRAMPMPSLARSVPVRAPRRLRVEGQP